jgi:4-hydroxy-3-polyprenylbenzoate decarboxylase
MISPEKRDRSDYTHSTAQIIACRPYHWKDKFPKPAKSSSADLKATREKWAQLWESVRGG